MWFHESNQIVFDLQNFPCGIAIQTTPQRPQAKEIRRLDAGANPRYPEQVRTFGRDVSERLELARSAPPRQSLSHAPES